MVKRARALVPISGNGALPQIHLSGTDATRPEILLPEPGQSGAGTRLKWLAGNLPCRCRRVCMIGGTIYASMDMEDGKGIVSSFRSAGLSAMQPIRVPRADAKQQAVVGGKSDRIQTTALGLSTRHIIRDKVTQQRGGREFIDHKSYARIVARLATSHPEDAASIPRFNPFKLYANRTPIADHDSANTGRGADRQSVLVRVTELSGRRPAPGRRHRAENRQGRPADRQHERAVSRTAVCDETLDRAGHAAGPDPEGRL